MLRHSHGEQRFKARRVFVGRKEHIEQVGKALRRPQRRNEHRIMAWDGVGGQGKSRLCRELQERLFESEGVALGSVDFRTPRFRRAQEALLKLRGDINKTSGLHFPTFDLAFARLFSLERPGENIRNVYPHLFRKGESEILDDLIDWSESGMEIVAEGASLIIPGANLVYKYGSRFTGRMLEWWSSKSVKKQISDLDSLSAEELSNKLPIYFGFDLWRAQDNDSCPRIVLSFDTHEMLWASEGSQSSGEILRVDNWLQILVRESPGALVLIFGRDPLRWSELNSEWDSAIEQKQLVGLSKLEMDYLLTQVPIPDPAIRERIVEGSGGLP